MPYDLYFSSYGAPYITETLLRLVATRAFTLPANVAGSQFRAITSATASTVFSIQKNGVQVATATFAASGTVATFSTQAAVSFAIGDRLSVVSPGTADATLADIDFTFLTSLA
jgi:hypothetical protein